MAPLLAECVRVATSQGIIAGFDTKQTSSGTNDSLMEEKRIARFSAARAQLNRPRFAPLRN